MGPNVCFKAVKFAIGSCAVWESALVGLVSRVHVRVTSQMCSTHKTFFTVRTLEGFVVSLY